jgi:hypothetical protein
MKCIHCNHPIENHMLQGGCGLCACPFGRTTVELQVTKARLSEAERLLAIAATGIVLSGETWKHRKQEIAAFLAAKP